MTRRALQFALGVTVMCAMLSGCGGGDGSDSSVTATVPSKDATFADVVARVRSGVMRIESDTCGDGSIGTGFLVSPRLVVTVAHVVDGATSIQLKRDGRRVARGVVIGADATRDLALIRADKRIEGYVFSLENTAPRLGDEVGALGFPLGLPLTVTKGSVSGLDRAIVIEGVKRRKLVQTDAAVNHGNSGGPLIALDSGQVVGLVDAGTTEANGVAFAVNSRLARALVQAWRVAPQPVGVASCARSGGAGSVSQAQAGPPPTDSATADDRAYSDAVDDALINSAKTKRGLGDLIAYVNDGSISYSQASDAIQSITEQRRSLLAAVIGAPAPPSFVRSSELLKASLDAAISDDLAIASWIDAVYAGDASGAQQYFAANVRLSAVATRAKAAFLSEYNSVRRRLLHRASLDVKY